MVLLHAHAQNSRAHGNSEMQKLSCYVARSYILQRDVTSNGKVDPSTGLNSHSHNAIRQKQNITQRYILVTLYTNTVLPNTTFF